MTETERYYDEHVKPLVRMLGTQVKTVENMQRRTDRAERRMLTVFFSDIKDFTGISEQLTASAIVNLLNSYFSAVAAPIHAHHGVIDKFIGDASWRSGPALLGRWQ